MGSSKLIQSIKAIFEDQLLAVLSTREGISTIQQPRVLCSDR